MAQGLLGFLETPAGMGLLSGIASYAMNARRGEPVNNLGRGFVGGLAGYTGAKDQINKESDNALTRQYRQMQMQELESKIAQQKALREAATSAYQDATNPAQFAVGGQTFPNQQAAQMSAESMFSLPSSAAPGTDQPLMSFQSGQQAPASIADFSGGQVPQVTQQQTPSVRNAMYTRLMQAGFPEEATKYAPKEAEWIVSERYNEKTGMPEKVLMNKNDPTDIRPFGGAQADTVVADNLGGQLVYRGSRSATPLGVMDKTATPDALMTDARTRAEGAANRAVSIRGQDLTDARARESNSNANSRAPAGYRFNAEGNLEVIPGGPADAKELARREGGNTVDTVIATLRDQYDQLEKGGGIVSTNQDVASNIGARVSSSGLGQLVGGTIGTKNQSARDTVAQTRPVLLQAIMKATGMSAKQMDSNAELKLYLATATDPTLGLEANRNALAMIEKLYGSGSRAKSSDTPTSDRYQEYLDAFKRAKTPEQRRAITERARQNGVVK